jgi:hypothetical protein
VYGGKAFELVEGVFFGENLGKAFEGVGGVENAPSSSFNKAKAVAGFQTVRSPARFGNRLDRVSPKSTIHQ